MLYTYIVWKKELYCFAIKYIVCPDKTNTIRNQNPFNRIMLNSLAKAWLVYESLPHMLHL